jgi:hypothetical protein
MNIPVNAKVYCQNKVCEITLAVILDPVNEIVTHLVVKERKAPHVQRLVPINMVDGSLNNIIHLKCDEVTLKDFPPFVELDYIQASIPRFTQAYGIFYMEPVVVVEKKMAIVKHYHIPRNELTVNRGMPVYSAEGYSVGKVDEFLVEQDGGHVTHLILRDGHLWGQKDIIIPVAELENYQPSL